MTDDSLEQYEYILREDLQAYLNGLDEADFGFCNILSNRLITNSIILKSKLYTLLGVILKEITYEFRFFKEENDLNKATRLLNKILKKYITNISELNFDEVIQDYLNYFKEFRLLVKNNFENYKENKLFSHFTIVYCIKFYLNELNFNDIPLNLDVLIFGVLSEINRVIKSHGCETNHLLLKIILNSFGRMYEYFRFFLEFEGIQDRWIKKYDDFKDKLVKNLKKFIEDHSYIEDSLDFLFEICEEWRLMYIRMLEIPKTSIIEKQVTVPKKVKEDLNGIVSDLINTKLEEKKND